MDEVVFLYVNNVFKQKEQLTLKLNHKVEGQVKIQTEQN